jgi:Ala-tRNA(Pro) deacylase
VVLRTGSDYVLAVLPADQRLDLRKVRDELEPAKPLELIDETEMAHEFPEYQVGAIPPCGVDLPAAEIIDCRLLDEDRILCASGDHMHSVLIDPRDLVAVTGARVADICQA